MIRWFASHPTVPNLLMLLVAVIGVLALPGINRETLPAFAPSQVQVQVTYPGASAEDVEESICLRLENAIDRVGDVAEIRCEAREGIAKAVAEMRDGGEFTRFIDTVKTEVEAIDSFPEEVEPPVITQLGRNDQVVSVAVTGSMAPRDLKAYAEELKDRLRQHPAVSQVEIKGFSDHQFRIEVSEAALRSHGLSLQQLADVIARQGIDLPAGGIETGERNLLIRFTELRRTLPELQDLVVVGSEQGAVLRLGQIARITDRFELDEERVEFNGRRAAVLEITKTQAEDALTIVAAVRQFVEQERRSAPPSVELHLTQDVASAVQDQLRLLVTNGAQGLLLVFIVMWLFFQPRVSFWVAMSLPVSFLGALSIIALLGYSINMITMVGLLISIGLLMDDSIVIAENVARHLARGCSALEAAVVGTREVAPGVLSSFFTTAAVFAPLAFLEGDIGKVLRVMPVVLISVLVVSLLEAFLILPNHLSHALSHAKSGRDNRFRRGFDAWLDRIRERWVGPAVDWAVEHRYLFIGAVAALFIVSLGMLVGDHLKFRAFPDIEGDTIEARILLPQGTPLWRTDAVVKRVVRGLEEVDRYFSPLQPDEGPLLKAISIRHGENLGAHERGAHVATVSADLPTAQRRAGRIEDYLARWREAVGQLPDVIDLTFKEPDIGPAGLPIDIRLSGLDLPSLKAVSLDLQEWLARFRGVQDLTDDLRSGKPELRLRLKDRALGLGPDAADIAQQLRAAFFGAKAKEIQVGRESYEIDVRLPEKDRNSLLDLEDFRVITSAGDPVPLSELAEIGTDRGWARIHRIDGRRTVTVQGDVDTRLANSAKIIRLTMREFLPKLVERYPGLRVDLEGQAAETLATGRSLARSLLIGLIVIFLLLSLQFHSYLEPLVIMMIIPLALIGVVWGYLLMGLDLSMPSIVGFVSLAGIVVNDSILLVIFIKAHTHEGLSLPNAAKLASRQRFRAVLLTSLTTTAGMLPLLAERSVQAQILIPLVTSLVFGLLATTVLVLLVVPALFSILHDWRSAKAQRKKEVLVT